MRGASCGTVLLLLSFLSGVQVAMGQNNSLPPQPGFSAERTLAGGQFHNYTIGLEQGQFLKLVFDQRGIDVVVRTFSPAGERLGEFDSPNGTNGPENVTVVATSPGKYRIEVTPLDSSRNLQPGRYEIQIADLRNATDQEVKAGKSREILKARGVALLLDVIEGPEQLHRPEARAGMEIRAAHLLWDADEKHALLFMQEAMDNVKQFIANADITDPDYYRVFQSAMQLRRQAVDILAPHDPKLALDFLRSTRLANPDGPRGNAQNNQELQIELTVAGRIAATDSKLAFQIAEDTLKEGASNNMMGALMQLSAKDPELGAKLSRDVAAALAGEQWLQHPEAANLAAAFLQYARTARRPEGFGTVQSNVPPIPEGVYRELFQKMIGEALSYSLPYANSYSPERNAAQNLINALKSMPEDLQKYAPDRAAEVERKRNELNQANLPYAQYQTVIDNSTIDAALGSISQAPTDMRDQLYQQLANKAAQAGDLHRARQIITDHIENPRQSQQALRNLERQTIYSEVSGRKLDDALRDLANFRPEAERMQLLAQVVNQIGPGIKKSAAMMYLEQIRFMLGASSRVESQQQMSALLALGRAFSRYESNRAFEIVEPLIDQFNDISAAALALNGFGQKYYEDGEVIVDNGNPVGGAANDLANTLGTLAPANFERAKAAANRIRLADVRLRAYASIAEQAIQPTR